MASGCRSASMNTASSFDHHRSFCEKFRRQRRAPCSFYHRHKGLTGKVCQIRHASSPCPRPLRSLMPMVTLRATLLPTGQCPSTRYHIRRLDLKSSTASSPHFYVSSCMRPRQTTNIDWSILVAFKSSTVSLCLTQRPETS